MTLSDYFKVIESATFQLQFSVLSGLGVVQFALSRDQTVRGLLDMLKHESGLAESLYRRIRYLQPRVSQETNLSYDESIVAYLYCLNKTDLLFAYRASRLIWDTEGLLWSRWLAFKTIQLVQQIEQSLDISSVDSVSNGRSIAEEVEFVDTRSLATTSAVTFAGNPDTISSYAIEFSTAVSEVQ